MDCTEARRRLHAYLDRELDRPGSMALEQHLASCAECKHAFAVQSALSAGIRRHADYHHGAPPELSARIRARPGSERKARWQWPQLGRWLPVGAAAALAAVISWTAAIQYASAPADPTLAEQVIAGHARAIVTNHVIEVASSDQHTVKPWLSSKLDFSLPVPDLATAGFPLAGGRLDYLDNRTVAALVYHSRRHVIDLFVWPDAKPGDAPPRTLSKQGYNVLWWKQDGMNYWAVSDVNPADLKAFTEAYASAK